MEQYQFPCGCEVIEDGAKVLTKRCDDHKKRYPHKLDEKVKK